MRLIDVDAFKADYCMADECKDCKTPVRACEYDRIYTKMDFCSWLDDAPTIEPERKTGRWNFIGDNLFECTCCLTVYSTQQLNGLRNDNSDPYAPRFCPNCGASMTGKEGAQG